MTNLNSNIKNPNSNFEMCTRLFLKNFGIWHRIFKFWDLEFKYWIFLNFEI